MQSKTLFALILAVAAAASVAAQVDPVRPVDNPYQEGKPYTIGEDLTPNVDVDGVRWTLVRLEPRDGRSVDPETETPVVADLRFDNRSDRRTRISVVVLLEDQNESPLQRLQFPSFKLGANRVREIQHEFTVPGSDLDSTRSVYLFCQVE